VQTQSPIYNQQYSGTGVAPTFVKCLHDVSTVNGQLVVLECRLRGTPPLQVMWYREDEQILDSDDFRILRKSECELCTLVITEAFPEDSGLFKCVVINHFGTVSCSAILDVYNGGTSIHLFTILKNSLQAHLSLTLLLFVLLRADLEEQQEMESFCQTQSVSKSVSQTQSQFQSLIKNDCFCWMCFPSHALFHFFLLFSVSSLPKPILKKSVAPRPSSSRSTDEDIQGSKDALIQDLEKKLRSKEARRRNNQKLSYEERMARRLLGPDNATYMFDQDNLSDSQLDQVQHLFCYLQVPSQKGRRHSGTDERGNEGSAIQEKCYAPRFLQIPSDLTVEEGRFCRIDFKVGGLPTPDLCWYLDGKAIRPDDYHKMLVCEKGMHSFIIEIVTVHHAGVYECVARNRAGESRFTMRLDVLAQEVLRPPTFVQKMLNSRALEGDTVRLECKVDASPPPQLFWKKDKDMLRIDPNRMSLYQDGSGRQCLLIERLMKSDAGWYTLSAINEAGMSTCNARLDVARTTPAMKTAPPGSKTLKLLSSLSHVPALTVESPAQHTAPLYESEEL
uniref:Myotilin n=1 Tax=Acanthochromis polyacanthus TaxID=80966 RepID=A0A3Q1GEU4_9TELE